MLLVLEGEERERDDREREVRELVPDARDRDGKPHGRPSNPHERSIEYDAAMPTAAPAGATSESAVDACVIASASQ